MGDKPSVQNRFDDGNNPLAAVAPETNGEPPEDILDGHEHRITFPAIASADLDKTDYSVEYLIDNVLVAGQPCVLAGPQKVMKTSAAIDMAVSLSVGGHFLGYFKVEQARRVAVMSGESGMATLQETARRIAKAARHDLGDLTNLVWCEQLPQFGNVAHQVAFEDFRRRAGTALPVERAEARRTLRPTIRERPARREPEPSESHLTAA